MQKLGGVFFDVKHLNGEINSDVSLLNFSPSGNVLRTIGEIKDYLLSAGTCKCGLPCPFRPELFFNFDSQVSELSGRRELFIECVLSVIGRLEAFEEF